MNGISVNQKTQESAQNATHPTGIENAERKKRCSKCGAAKRFSDYNKHKSAKDGLKSQCRECSSMESKKYFSENKDRILEKNRILYGLNIENENRRSKKYRENNYEKESDRGKKYYSLNKSTISKSSKLRRDSNPNVKLSIILRSRLSHELKNIRRIDFEFCLELLGCSLDELTSHIESQFKKGMSWSNHSHTGWHIDHIKPCVSFDFNDPNQQRECFHYSNMQPLWAHENIKKRDEYKLMKKSRKLISFSKSGFRGKRA